MRLIERLVSWFLAAPPPVQQMREVRQQAQRVRQALNGRAREPEDMIAEIIRVAGDDRR